MDTGEASEKTTKQTIDWSKTPPPTSPWRGWVTALIWVAVGVLVLGVLPLLIRWGQGSGFWRNITSFKLPAEPEQVVSILDSSDSGVLITVDHRGIRQVEFVISDTLHTVELSQGVAHGSKPVMSPRGDLVAFVVVEGGKRKIKIAPIQRRTFILTDDDQIAGQGTTNGLPELGICDDSLIKWSPDASALALFACTKAKSVIITVNLGTKAVQVIKNTDNKNKPSRSLVWLDTSRIAFVEQTTPGIDQVFVINLDGSNKTPIVSGP